MKTINNGQNDRENLELLVYIALTDENPCITISSGCEFLGFRYMEDMRKWLAEYKPPIMWNE